GGAFGSALRLWPHATIAALAARHVRRPVRLELTRRELYTGVGFRPHTAQRLALGARRDGTLAAIVHEATAQTSAYEQYTEETLFADGTALVRTAASDMGPGTYTSMTQVAADALGLPIERVRFELGDTDFPDAPVHGGSITMASVGNAVHAACETLCRRLRTLGDGDGRSYG